MPGLQRDGNLREGPVTSSDRDDRIGGLGDQRVPGVPESRADDGVQVPVPIPGIRNNTDGQAATFLCTPARCFHHAGEPPADQYLVIFCNQVSHSPGRFILLR